MKVKELIQQLSTQDQEADVIAKDDYGWSISNVDYDVMFRCVVLS